MRLHARPTVATAPPHAQHSSSTTDQTSPSPNPKRSQLSKLPRADTHLQKDLPVGHALPHAAMVLHAQAHASMRTYAPNHQLARDIHMPYNSWRVRSTCPTQLPTIGVCSTRAKLSTPLLLRVLRRARHISPNSLPRQP